MTKIKGYKEEFEYEDINGKECELTTLTIYISKEVQNEQSRND